LRKVEKHCPNESEIFAIYRDKTSQGFFDNGRLQCEIIFNLLKLSDEPIITMVKKLAEHCLPAKDLENLKKMFDDPKRNKFMLSNEEVRLMECLQGF